MQREYSNTPSVYIINILYYTFNVISIVILIDTANSVGRK